MQKAFVLLIALLGCIASVSATNLRLLNRVSEIHEFHTRRNLARGVLKRRGGVLSNNYGFYAFLQGLSTGLQFQEGYDSTCSMSIEGAIFASEAATDIVT